MNRKQTSYTLLVIDDGERVLEESFTDEAQRARALHELIRKNHDEIELVPTDVTEPAEIIDWYLDEAISYGLDIYLDEVETLAPAPQDLFHAVSSYSNGEALEVASYASEEARRLGLVIRAQDCEMDGIVVLDDAAAEQAIEALEEWLPVEITLVDAHGYENEMEWYT